MRTRNAPHAIRPDKVDEHLANLTRAKANLKHHAYVEEVLQNGSMIRTGVVCKCCGIPLMSLTEIDDMQSTERHGRHTTTTKYVTPAATSAYAVATIELENAQGLKSKHQTPICQDCARHPDTDWQGIYDIDIERLRQCGMDISNLIGLKFVRLIEIEAA